MKRTRTTIADVARESGVSTMTVSRVLNGKGEISSETRRRVQRTIDRLGFRPSAVARGLATRRTRTVGVMVPDVANPFFPEIVRGAEDVAWQHGYTIMLSSSGERDAREAAILRRFEEVRVDGVILCSARMPDVELAPFLERHDAAVLVNREPPRGTAMGLEVDDAHGAHLATRHLLDGGHEVIGILRGPDRAYSARRRLHGHRRALGEAGVPFDADLVEVTTPDARNGATAAAALLARRPDLTALLCHNDLVAVGALQACRERGASVPDDVAVVGCDDIPLARLVAPGLTTLRSAKTTLGREAMLLLLGLLDGGRPPPPCALLPQIVVRESAPARRREQHG